MDGLQGVLRRRLRRCLIAALLVAAWLIVVPAASAAVRAYLNDRTIPAYTAYTDGVRHNHYYNEVYWSPGANWSAGLFERTACCGVKWEKISVGNFAYSHDPTWYAEPFCHNRSGSAHFADHCSAAW
jgi:hypothetical protein